MPRPLRRAEIGPRLAVPRSAVDSQQQLIRSEGARTAAVHGRIGIVSEVDLSRLPTGEIGWAALVTYASSSDDRIERYFLEVKSDIDLNTRSGRAKVAKFVLGAANRDFVQASRRLGGHAVMLLGVGGGRALGVPAFEAQDLGRDMTKWLGVDGPKWDFERVSTEDGDVIAIIADPPTGDVWTCRADGEGLADGDIYVRADGNTRKATGDEVRAMLTRVASRTPTIDVRVQVDGAVAGLRVDEERLAEGVEARAAAYQRQVEPPPTRSAVFNVPAISGLGIDRDTRSRGQFLTEVEQWRTKALAAPSLGLVPLAGRMLDCVRVEVQNLSRTFLSDVRIDIEFEGDVLAAEWLDREDGALPDLFLDSPLDWGEKTVLSSVDYMALRRAMPVTSRSRHGMVQIQRTQPAHLVLLLDNLRPEEHFISDGDELVLLKFVDEPAGDVVTASWRMTAAGRHDVYQGRFSIPVFYRDWRDAIAKVLSGEIEPEAPATG